MTKLCTSCGSEKRGNESEHVITFEEDFEIALRRSFFDCPDITGTTYKVKYAIVPRRKKCPIAVAVKWSRKEHLCDPAYHFCSSLLSSDETSKVIAAFMDTIDTAQWKIKVVKPTLLGSPMMDLTVEPFVENFLEFTEIPDTAPGILRHVAEIMAALSHFSYVFSKGEYVITNLKGGIDEQSLTVMLIPPTLLSNERGCFGCEDFGSIRRYFFSGHVCNHICEGMKTPKIRSSRDEEESEDPKILFTPRTSTEKD